MDPFNCRGLIIKSDDYKEKDRLLSVLTSDRGLITICAKGVAKPGSSFGFVSMPYMLCDFVVSVSHGYYYLKDASIIESNSGIMESLEQMTVAAHPPSNIFTGSRCMKAMRTVTTAPNGSTQRPATIVDTRSC